MTPSDCIPQDWTCRYEGLRLHAIEPNLQPGPLGLAVLMRHGVAHWMGAWSDSTTSSVSDPRMAFAPGWEQWRTPLTQLLAHITLQHVSHLGL
jgi:hypothetical protein